MKAKILGMICAFVILLAMPFVSALSFSPSTAYSNDDITCLIGSPEMHVFRWYNGGTFLHEGQTLSNGFTTRGQTYTCKAYIDLFGSLTLEDLGDITISNALPVVSSLAFLNEPYFIDAMVNVSAVASDADGDPLTYNYIFSIPGAVLQNSTSNVYDGSGVLVKGDVVTVTVEVSDGTDITSLSNSTTIQNSAPNDVVVSAFPPYYVGDTIYLSASASDPDGDSVDFDFRFYNLNDSTELQAYPSPGAYTILASSAHDTIRAYVNVSDGSSSFENFTDIYVSNTEPFFGWIGVYMDQDTNSSINLSESAEDEDGDSIIFSAIGSQNVSITLSGDNLTFIPNPGFIGKQNITVTLDDGYGNYSYNLSVTVLDTQDPTVEIIHPANDQIFNISRDVIVNYTVSDNGVLDTCGYGLFNRSGSDLASGFVNCSQTNFTLLNLPNLDYTLVMYASDSEDNIGISNWINFTMDYNSAPSVDMALISPLSAYTDDDLECIFSITDNEQTSLTAFYNWYNDSGLVLSGSMNVLNGSYYSTILDSGNTSKHENWTCQIIPNDGILNGTEGNASRIILNSPPAYASIPDIMENWTRNLNKTINLSDYFSDADNDALNFTYDYYAAAGFTPGSLNVYIDNSTGIVILEPTLDFEAIIGINFTAYDPDFANTTSNLVGLFIGTDTIIESYLNDEYVSLSYSIVYDGSSGEKVIGSFVNQTNLTSRIDVLDSYLLNDTINNSIIIDCTILDSNIESSNCLDSYIDPSDVQYSNITSSTIVNSTVYYSNVTDSIVNNTEIYNSSITNSNLTNSYISNVTMSDSYLFNTNLENTVVQNANITDGTIYDGTILMSNGTIYNATLDGSQGLEQLVNYDPVASILSPLNGSNFATSQNISFFSNSSDVNIGGFLGDSLTFLWNFGDGNTASTENTSHIYSSAGLYNVNLTVTDSHGKQNGNTMTIRVSDPPSILFVSPLNQTYGSLINLNLSSNGQSIWFYNGTENVTYSAPVSLTLSEGSYTFIAYANNTYGIINETSMTFSVDTTAPYVAIANPANITYDTQSILVNITNSSDTQAVWFNWNGTNQTYTSPVYVSFNEGSNTLNVYANDSCGNLNQTAVTFSVVLPATPSTGGGSSGGDHSPETQILDGKTVESRGMKEGEYVTFKVNGVQHKVTLLNIYATFVRVKIESTPITAFLDMNVPSKFDLDNNGYYDLELKLERIWADNAEINFKLISEKIVSLTNQTVYQESKVTLVENKTIEMKNATEPKKFELKDFNLTGKWNSFTGMISSDFNDAKKSVLEHPGVYVSIILGVVAIYIIGLMISLYMKFNSLSRKSSKR